MSLSMLVKKRSYSCHQNSLRHSFEWPTTCQPISNPNPILNPTQSYLNLTKWRAVWGMGILLVFLNGMELVRGSNLAIQPLLPTADEMLNVLQSIGFLVSHKPSIIVAFYNPSQSSEFDLSSASVVNPIPPQHNTIPTQLNSIPPQLNPMPPQLNSIPPQLNSIPPQHNTILTQLNPILTQLNPIPPQPSLTMSALDNTPSYVVSFSDKYIKFVLAPYLDQQAAIRVLCVLRRIAAIRATHVVICYQTTRDCCCENLQILSRLANMFECTEIEFCFDWQQKANKNSVAWDLITCCNEAINTLNHTNRSPLHLSVLVTGCSMRSLETMLCGIIILRKLLSISFFGEYISNISYITTLPLIECYHIRFNWDHGVRVIDLGFLQAFPNQCSMIILKTINPIGLSLTGLENLMTNHSRLILFSHWPIIRHLGEHNSTPIRVFGLIGIEDSTASIQEMLGKRQVAAPPPPQLFATYAVCCPTTTLPCDILGYCKHIYTREALANCGISTRILLHIYEQNRLDLYTTLNILYQAKALLMIPEKIQRREIVCLGDKLSDPRWVLKEKVDLKLTNYTADDAHVFFCQNIYYTDISIGNQAGPECYYKLNKCLKVLNLFQNIKADKLRLLNIYEDVQVTNHFDMNILLREMNTRPCYRLCLQVLVLDNVDIRILYWMLTKYVFVVPFELHVLNMRFTNLAIAQILSLPQANNIKQLVMNDFVSLNEVKYFKRQTKITGFSLFKHMMGPMRKEMTVKDFILDKLLLWVSPAESKVHSTVLRALAVYGIQNQIVLSKQFDDPLTYIRWSTLIKRRNVILLGVLLSLIKRDLSAHQASPQTTELLQSSSAAQLSLSFCDQPLLTEADLVAIIRWTICRFRALNSLRIERVVLSAQERSNIAARNYLTVSPSALQNIYIGDKCSSAGPLELTLKPYHQSLGASVVHTHSTTIAVPSAMLCYFLVHHAQPNSFIARYVAGTESFYQGGQAPGSNPSCLVCGQHFSRSPEEAESSDAQPAAKRSKLDPNPCADGRMLLYFMCGHSVCNACAVHMDANLIHTCPACKSSIAFNSVYYLLCVPIVNFIVVEGCMGNPANDLVWLKSMATLNGYIYFYLPHNNIVRLAAELSKEPAHASANYIHVI
ncbi:hypothetical protein NEHOM01_2045 [Nematocida homosporus]|uniref:uncharacterized protein n=1 Tax=Nematocida homosporus TaxID=1912981 RepID=UPI00221FDBB2|nr:uncharacterized protein NEHOM01_2045 [Nematocida homosporus]KAI5187254.1 hypothetical protein NEHOM01_2045 [Nematocida homosporus]